MHPLCNAGAFVQMGLTQVVARGFWLVEQLQHFQMRRSTARQRPVDSVSRTQTKKRGTHRSKDRKLCTAVGHLRQVDQRSGQLFTGGGYGI